MTLPSGGHAGDVQHSGDAEVGEYHPGVADKDVARFQIAVDHPGSVHVCKGIGHLGAQSGGMLPGERAFVAHQHIQAGAGDILHDDPGSALEVEGVVDRDDVLMAHPRRGLRLNLHPRSQRRAFREGHCGLEKDLLDGDGPLKPLIVAAPHVPFRPGRSVR